MRGLRRASAGQDGVFVVMDSPASFTHADAGVRRGSCANQSMRADSAWWAAVSAEPALRMPSAAVSPAMEVRCPARQSPGSKKESPRDAHAQAGDNSCCRKDGRRVKRRWYSRKRVVIEACLNVLLLRQCRRRRNVHVHVEQVERPGARGDDVKEQFAGPAMLGHAGTAMARSDVKLDIISGSRWTGQGRIGGASSSLSLANAEAAFDSCLSRARCVLSVELGESKQQGVAEMRIKQEQSQVKQRSPCQGVEGRGS